MQNTNYGYYDIDMDVEQMLTDTGLIDSWFTCRIFGSANCV